MHYEFNLVSRLALIFHEGWWLPLAFVGRVSGSDFMVRV
jgi:hypothetical protein